MDQSQPLPDLGQVPEHLRRIHDQAQATATPAVDQRPPPPPAASATPAPPPSAPDPRSRRTYRFTFEYTDLDKEVWRGVFLSQMPSIGEEIEIQKRVASMQHIGGDARLPEATRDSIFALCFMDVCLKDRPDWARDLGALPEQELFDALAKEVHAHFATFQRRRERARSGA